MAANLLFICGSLNQTTIMHQISKNLTDFSCHFSPFYAEGVLATAAKTPILQHSILGGNHYKQTSEYLLDHDLPFDFGGRLWNYDLVFTCTDLIIQSNIRKNRLILVQEGITETEDFAYHLVKRLKFPRLIANTAATGLSDAYDRFCVASQGYRGLFIQKGVNPEKIIVTGIPNFDHVEQFQNSSVPWRHYVLVATSSIRETGKFDHRLAFLSRVLELSNDKTIIFRLHPNENMRRAEREILQVIPEAIILKDGNTAELIANCDMLITQVSSVVYFGIALGKKVYSYHNLQELKRLMPIQNKGTSAIRIAEECRALLNIPMSQLRGLSKTKPRNWVPVWLLPD